MSKRLQKLIVMSAAYPPVVGRHAGTLQRDPENRLLARGPRFRLDAETVRDTAPAVSGLLVEKLGVRRSSRISRTVVEAVAYSAATPASTGATPASRCIGGASNLLEADRPAAGDGHLRRPDRETCSCAPRDEHPLQALVLMNDVAVRRAGPPPGGADDDRRGRDARRPPAAAFLLATCRPPTPDEARVLVRVYQQQLAEFRQSPAAATNALHRRFAGEPIARRGELAAWTMVANLILNLDETITKG